MAALRCAKYCDPFGVDALAQIGIDQRGVDQQIDRAIELLFPPLLQAEEGVGVAARRLVFRQGYDNIQIAAVRAEVLPCGRRRVRCWQQSAVMLPRMKLASYFYGSGICRVCHTCLAQQCPSKLTVDRSDGDY